jgi:hypothetical protein
VAALCGGGGRGAGRSLEPAASLAPGRAALSASADRTVAAAAQQPADTADKPISLGGQSEYLGEIDHFPLQITGFAVGDYDYAGRTGANSFSASKISLSVFREITNHAYVFGQLTTALEAPAGGGEPTTETEIDNLQVSVVTPGASSLNLNFGKLDLPLGFERDDEPLNFLVSPSFNLELARPVKMVGLEGTWTPGPRASLSAFLFNGWDSDLDPNHGKSGGVRLELLPRENVTLGLNGLTIGKEDLSTIQREIDFSPQDPDLSFYLGKTGDEALVGVVFFPQVNTPHGPLEVGLTMGPDGSILNVAVTKATVETKPWVEQAIRGGLLDRFKGMRYGDDVGSALNQLSAGEIGNMPYWEGQVITTAVHHGLVLYHVLFRG